mmetsp:Transcript_50693/g.113925  ORF Transcript_50693/g.113925 Transcript_50693/m.113925 type:complete len:87 (+) Transcript_50693:127-387(+)
MMPRSYLQSIQSMQSMREGSSCKTRLRTPPCACQMPSRSIDGIDHKVRLEPMEAAWRGMETAWQWNGVFATPPLDELQMMTEQMPR